MDGPIPNAIGTSNPVCTFTYAKEKKSKKNGNLNLSTKMSDAMRKSVYAVCSQRRHSPAWAPTESD